MNTLGKIDAYFAPFLLDPALPNAHPRLSNLPPVRRRGRRPKPTMSSIKVPPPTTPLLLRIMLALWSILLSLWTSMVVETRAERVKRRRRRPTLTRNDEGSASEGEGAMASDDDWIDPVTRQQPDENVDEPDDDEFAPRQDRRKDPISFSLPSAGKRTPETPETPKTPKTFVQQPTPPSILSNPIPQEEKKRKTGRLLPNPIATAVLDPTVPVVPASHTHVTARSQVARPQATPIHLRKTLILDLDETLIHSTSRPISYSASAGGGILGFGGLRRSKREGHAVEVVLRGRSTMYHVYKRPHVDHFLKKVAQWYTLVIYTASMPEYADPVIDWLDAGRGLFSKRFYRDSCHLHPNGSYIKDLTIVEPDLSRACFMDNSPISYSWNKANALPIEGWTSDPNDEALLHSIPVLDSLRFVSDVRRILGIRGFT